MKTFTQKIFSTILLFIGLSSLTFAQTGMIKGKVASTDGEPIEGVSIALKDLKKGTATNEEGRFSFKNLAEGKYSLLVTFTGMKLQEKDINVVAGQTTNVDFKLAEDTQMLSNVVVSGNLTTNEKPVNIGKIAIKPLDLPQSVAIIDRNIIERQQVLRLSDVLMNANGVYMMGTTGGYQEEIAGRGFAFNSTNTFKNGARYFNGVMPEVSSLERIEIMKGSSAILFGNVAAGGVINLVTKKPKFEQGGQVSMRAGSFGFYKPSFDVYGSILNSGKLAYRLNATYEKANSFRDNVSSERFFVNPSLLWKISKKTDILLEADYLKDHRTADFGSGAINYAIADIPRGRFLGTNWSYNDISQRSATATITHHFTEKWQIRAVGAYQEYQSDLFANLRPNGNNQFIKTDGKWIRGVQRSEVSQKYFLGQVDLTGEFQTGKIKHLLLIGADIDQYNTQTTAYNNIAKYDSINVFNLDLYKQRTDIPTMTVNTVTTAPINRAGVYVQDLVSFSEKIKALVGIRYSYQETGSQVYTASTKKTTESYAYNGAFTPRLGLVYQPTKTSSIFASYANSFTLNTGVDISGNALAPSFINQTEVGIKNELFNGILTANVTAYQIVNSNLAQISLANGNTNTNIKELAGEVTSKGIEIDLISKPYNGFSFIGGYSFNETKYTKSNTYIEGSRLLYNPQHTGNASVYYTFSKVLKGLNVGFTALYVGDRQAGRSTRVQVTNDTYKPFNIPNFTQFDASVGYNCNKFSVRAKVANLLNKLSYYVHDDNSVNPIAPINFSTTVAFKF